MNHFLLLGCLVVGFALPLRAQELSFTQSVASADAAEAGIAHLTPAQKAKLDSLIAQYQSGALAAARKAALAAAQAQAAAEARATAAVEQAQASAQQAKLAAEQAKASAERTKVAQAQAVEAKKKSASFLVRARALITPGTKIEYTAFDAHIVGKIGGWDANSVFLLDNGQRWQVSDFTHYFNGGDVTNPEVTIKPAGLMGGFELHIEGMGGMRVRLLNGPTYQESK